MRILLDLPELTGLTRELPLGPLVAKASEVLGTSAEYPVFLYERLLSVLPLSHLFEQTVAS